MWGPFFLLLLSPTLPTSQWYSNWVLAGTALKRSKEKNVRFLLLLLLLLLSAEFEKHALISWFLGLFWCRRATLGRFEARLPQKNRLTSLGKERGSIALLSHWSRPPLILLWKSCFDSCQTVCKQRPSLTLLLDLFLFFLHLFFPWAGGLVKRLCVWGKRAVEKEKKKIKK